MNDITFNLKNSLILVASLLFLLFAISQGFHKAEVEKEQKVQRFMQMSFEELGAYIVKKNSRKNRIDTITYIKPIVLEGDTLMIDYYVQEGFFYDAITSVVGLEKNRDFIYGELLSENCSKSAHRTFLNRGGKMRYRYYLVAEDKEDRFLFTFDIDKAACESSL